MVRVVTTFAALAAGLALAGHAAAADSTYVFDIQVTSGYSAVCGATCLGGGVIAPITSFQVAFVLNPVLSYSATGMFGPNTYHDVAYSGGVGEIDPLLELERVLAGRPPEAMAAIYTADFDKYYEAAPDNSISFTAGYIGLVGIDDGVVEDLGGGMTSRTSFLSEVFSNGYFEGLNNLDPPDTPDRVADYLGSRVLQYEFDRYTDYTCVGPVTCTNYAYVRYEGTATFNRAASTLAVPEPSAWALMIAGVGLAGVALRRRSRPTAKPAT